MPLTSTGVSLAVPLSQNTAQVREFRCLFTHDVRRKAKRWQDGFLSFHTFNNRAIVYDELRNRVGDTYARNGEPVAEGDEFKLQQGVLVEVGEAMGSREQDVTQVIVARDSSRTNATPTRPQVPVTMNKPISAVLPRPLPRDTTPAVQTTEPRQLYRPKSLKEVLSTPNGSMGRARLPDRSPFETRHDALTKAQQADQPIQICHIAGQRQRTVDAPPPKKRRRLEDEDVGGPRLRQRQRTPEQRDNVRSHHTQSSDSPTRVSKRGSRAASPIMLESDEESLQPSPPVTPMITQTTQSIRKDDVSLRKVSQKKPASEVAPKKVVRERDKPDKPAKRSNPPPLVKTTDARVHEARPLQERPVNLLRASTGGRRKKLMCKELLFSDSAPTSEKTQPVRSKTPQKSKTPASRSTQTKSRGSSKQEAAIQEDSASNEDVPQTDQAMNFDFDDDLDMSMLDREFSNQDMQIDAFESERPVQEPDPLPAPEPAPAPEVEAESDTRFKPPSKQRAGPGPALETASKPAAAPDPPAPKPKPPTMTTPASLAGPPLSKILTSTSGPAPMPAPTHHHQQQPQQRPQLPFAQPRAARPVHHHPPVGVQRASALLLHRSPLKRVTSAPEAEAEPARRQQATLQKSFSDLSNKGQAVLAVGALADENGNGGGRRGPWSREAFDLFGWVSGQPKGVGDVGCA